MSHYKVLQMEMTNRGIIASLKLSLDGTKSLVVSGPTGSGKTTAVSTLWDALELNPRVQKGTKAETLRVLLGDGEGNALDIRRVNKDNGKSEITITDDRKKSVSSKAVKDLLNTVSKNPLALMEKTGKERFNHLLKCSCIDVAGYDELCKKRDSLAEERKSSHQMLAYLTQKKGDSPEKTEPVDVTELMGQLDKVNQTNDTIKEARTNFSRVCERNAAITQQIADLQAELNGNLEWLHGTEKWLESNPLIDTSDIQLAINEASATNEKANAYKAWEEKYDEWKKENMKWIGLEESVKSTDAEIKTLLDKIEFPLEGLSVQDSTILYHGIPYDSLGTSKQILISAVLTAQAMVKEKDAILAMRIDRGESMDLATQNLVIDICSALGVQLFISVVDRTAEGNFSIDIVEGKEVEYVEVL